MGEFWLQNQPMADPTQLDTCAEEDGDAVTLPVAEAVDVEPPPKRPRVVVSAGRPDSARAACSPRDSIKWVEDSAEGASVPFVLKAATDEAHCGRCVMKVVRLQSADGPSAVVECLKGCERGCGKTNFRCLCFCHLLRAHYISRDPVVHINL